jgi:hypothetical protein
MRVTSYVHSAEHVLSVVIICSSSVALAARFGGM